MDERRLLNLKQQIDDAKTEISQLEGRKANLLERLEEQWGCKTIKEAEKKLGEMTGQIESLDKKIQAGITKLEEEYEFE